MEFSKLEKLVGTGWAEFLKPFMCPDKNGLCRYDDVSRQLKERYTTEVVFPEMKNVFRCFKETPIETVRVVLMGQDPYPNDYANGLAFACDKQPLPKSLIQIYNAIERDVYNGLDLHRAVRTGVLGRPKDDDTIDTWTSQGVLLLNAALTVKEKTPASHLVIWEPFISFVVSNLWKVKKDLIYIVWGAKAKELTQYKHSTADMYGTDGLGESIGVNIFHAFICYAEHPAAAARREEEWITDNFTRCNMIIKLNKLGEEIRW